MVAGLCWSQLLSSLSRTYSKQSSSMASAFATTVFCYWTGSWLKFTLTNWNWWTTRQRIALKLTTAFLAYNAAWQTWRPQAFWQASRWTKKRLMSTSTSIRSKRLLNSNQEYGLWSIDASSTRSKVCWWMITNVTTHCWSRKTKSNLFWSTRKISSSCPSTQMNSWSRTIGKPWAQSRITTWETLRNTGSFQCPCLTKWSTRSLSA